MHRFRQLAARLALALALLVHGLPIYAVAAEAAEPATAPCHSHEDPAPTAPADCCDDCQMPCSGNVPATVAALAWTPAISAAIAPPVATPVAACWANPDPPQRPPIS